jgi:hypothetical protein
MKALLDLPEGHAKALHLLMTHIPDRLDWVLTGSAGLRLQGVNVPVHDLDIQSYPAGIDEIARILANCVRETPRWKESLQIRSHYGLLDIAGVQVELMGNIQHHMPDGGWSPVADIPSLQHWLAWQGRQVPVLDLAYEAQAYEEMGRAEKAAQIREVLCPKSSL